MTNQEIYELVLTAVYDKLVEYEVDGSNKPLFNAILELGEYLDASPDDSPTYDSIRRQSKNSDDWNEETRQAREAVALENIRGK